MCRVLGRNITDDREEGTITIDQKDCTEDIDQRYGMRGCNPAYTPGVRPKLSLYQLEENLLSEESKRRYQSIPGAAMYLVQVCRYNILHTVSQLASAMVKPSKAYMEATEHLLRYLGGSADFSITYYKEVSNSRPFPTRTGERTPTRGSLRHDTS